MNIPPQRLHLLRAFATALRKRNLTTPAFMLVLLQLRELYSADEVFYEWGSAVAHVKRNKGWVWEGAVSAWATQVYYAAIDRQMPKLSPLPVDIMNAIVEYVERISDLQIRNDFSDIYLGGIERNEIIATLRHLYSQSKKKTKVPERSAFYYLCSTEGISDNDQVLMSRLILAVENEALHIPPTSLSDVITSIETFLLAIKVMDTPFDKEDRIYLQLHLLVAFHTVQLEINPSSFKELTGHDLQGKEAMLFVSSMQSVLTLDIGFFYLEDNKYLEPAEFFTNSHIEKLYYPFVRSDLGEEAYLLESDVNIRVCLYNHPLEVAERQGRFVLIAHEREAARFPPTKPLFGRTTF